MSRYGHELSAARGSDNTASSNVPCDIRHNVVRMEMRARLQTTPDLLLPGKLSSVGATSLHEHKMTGGILRFCRSAILESQTTGSY